MATKMWWWMCLVGFIIYHLDNAIKQRILLKYKFYRATTQDNFHNYICKLLRNYYDVYLGAIFEEIIFRLPLLYSTNIYLYFALNVSFGLIHYDSEKSINIAKIIFTFAFGIWLSKITVMYGLLASISCHLLNNFLSTIQVFAIDYRSQNPRLMIRFLENEK